MNAIREPNRDGEKLYRRKTEGPKEIYNVYLPVCWKLFEKRRDGGQDITILWINIRVVALHTPHIMIKAVE